MSISPSRQDATVLQGTFSFTAQPKNKPSIIDSYNLRIVVPWQFPAVLPTVTEQDRKIPRDGKHHVNWGDSSLCMGSPLRLLWELSKWPDLVGFAETCLVPYLYNISYRLQNGGDYILGELPHGNPGVIQDYLDLFRLKTKDQVLEVLRLLGMKRRIANRRKCPCGCGNRLGRCGLHLKVNAFRSIVPRSWIRGHEKDLRSGN
jgi:hypothetical protein